MSASSELTDRLADVLAGRDTTPHPLASLDPAVVLDEATYHSVGPLLADRLHHHPGIPAGLRHALRDAAAQSAATDLIREAELRALVERFDAAGVRALLIKGAHLAYTVYPRPDLRPRVDSDLLIDPSDRDQAQQILLDLGYNEPQHVTGEVVSHQAMFVKRRRDVTLHAVDLHWKIANPQLFADFLSLDELWLTRVPVPRLSLAAAGLSAPHALLLACVHRVAHHYGSPCLIWLYDIHLLAKTMSSEQWETYVTLAQDRGMVTICRDGLAVTVQAFGTEIPREVIERLQRSRDEQSDRATAAYLEASRRPVDNFVADMRALPTWSKRVRLVREHLFPAPRYMREVYAPSSRAPLPVLYTRRMWKGARRWFARG